MLNSETSIAAEHQHIYMTNERYQEALSETKAKKGKGKKGPAYLFHAFQIRLPPWGREFHEARMDTTSFRENSVNPGILPNCG
jgi:hypothetical protein